MQFLRRRSTAAGLAPLPPILLALAVLLGGCGSGSDDALESDSGAEDSAVELDPGADETATSEGENAQSEDDVVELDPPEDDPADTSEGDAPPSEDDVVELDPADDDSTDTSEGDGSASGDGSEIVDELIEQMIGLPEDEAIAMAQAAGHEVRIESRNGEDFALTQEFEENRLNLTIADDVVKSVRVG